MNDENLKSNILNAKTKTKNKQKHYPSYKDETKIIKIKKGKIKKRRNFKFKPAKRKIIPLKAD